MELKPIIQKCFLNVIIVLIVPFMELKHDTNDTNDTDKICLNRTFYGIETPTAIATKVS